MYMGNSPPAKKKKNLYAFILLIGKEDICIGVDGIILQHVISNLAIFTCLACNYASNTNKYKYKALEHAKQCLISNYMPTKQRDPEKAIFKNKLTKIVFWLFLNKKRRY